MSTRIVRIPTLVAAGAAAAVALAACSSGSGTAAEHSQAAPATTGSTTSTSQQSAGSGTSENVTETEFHIAMPSTKLAAGTYTFHVKNAGSITHALTVDGPGFADKSTGDISPGSSATLTVTLKAGKYDVFCPVANHKMEGMDETVQVA